jgi:uncharacterized tellurite resistance protein B-like protein
MNDDDEQLPPIELPDVPESGPVFDLGDPSTMLATLMIYVARSDGEISSIESQHMVDLLVSNDGIRTAQAMERLSAAVMHLSDGDDVLRELGQAAAGLPLADKQGMFALLLEVAAADEVRVASEIEVLHKAADLLGLSEQEKHQAYQAYFKDSD